MKRIIYVLLCFCVMAIYSCTKTNENNSKTGSEYPIKSKDNNSSAGVKEGGIEFNVEYFSPREIYKIEKEDLNNDGNKEIIVMSVTKDTSEHFNDYFNFDMLEVFVLNPEKKSYKKILSDTVDFSKDYSFEDLANNKKKQIVIKTNSGGNDVIASNGMFIYDMPSNNEIKLLKYFDSGDPEIDDITENGTKEILVSDSFWGVMPAVNVINFVKEIYKLENDNLVLLNSELGEFYDNKIIELKEKYYGVKKKVEMGMQMNDLSYPLYREAAEVIINYYAKDDMEGLKRFWDEEKESLKKNISGDEFTDLSDFIYKVLPSAKNA